MKFAGLAAGGQDKCMVHGWKVDASLGQRPVTVAQPVLQSALAGGHVAQCGGQLLARGQRSFLVERWRWA